MRTAELLLAHSEARVAIAMARTRSPAWASDPPQTRSTLPRD